MSGAISSVFLVEPDGPTCCFLRGPTHEQSVPAAAVALHAAGEPGAVYVGTEMIALGGRILDGLAPAERPAFWDVIRDGRWVDIDRASFLLRLAGREVPPVGDPFDFGRNWSEIAAAGPYGQLGIGLDIGHVMALNRVPTEGVRLTDPVGLLDRLKEALRLQANARPWAHELHVRFRQDDTLSYRGVGAGASEWRERLIDSLRDRHGVPLGRLETRLRTVAVEHWPAWALAAKDAAAWRRLLSLNRLVRNRSEGSGVIRPQFGWGEGRVGDDLPTYLRDNVGAAGVSITDGDFHPDERIRRVSWTDIRDRALAEHLRRAHTGSGDLLPRVAVCLSTGVDEACAGRLFGGELPSGVFGGEVLPAALADHLADRALDAVLASGRFDHAAVKASVHAAESPGRDLFLAFSEGRLDHEPAAERIRAALTRSENRVNKLQRMTNGYPAGTYHSLTNETVTLRSGRQIGDLPWAAARAAEVLGEADEARRAIIVDLARAGEVVIGFDDDGGWVSGATDAAQEVMRACDRYFLG